MYVSTYRRLSCKCQDTVRPVSDRNACFQAKLHPFPSKTATVLPLSKASIIKMARKMSDGVENRAKKSIIHYRPSQKQPFFLSDGPPTCISQAAKRTGTVPGRLRGWERSDLTIFLTAKRTGRRHDGLRRRKRKGVWGFLAAKRTGTVPDGLRGWERSDFTIFMTAKRTGGRHDGLRRRKRKGVWGFLTAKRTRTVPGGLRGWERSDFTIFLTAKRTGGRHDGLRRRKRQGVRGFMTAKRTGTVPGGLRGMASPAIWLKIAGLVDIAHWRLSAGGIAC